jgi:tripartite-type tricarboxylate transporter receptor subunit TctC
MKTKMVVWVGIVLVAFVVPVFSADVKYPTKPINMWVGFAAGGSTDMLCRTVSNVAEKILGQPIVVDNKPGGGAVLCASLLAAAPPDGYTLGTTTDTPFTRAPHIVGVKYDPLKDFIPVIRISLETMGIVVKADSPFKKFQDLIDYARKNPGKLTYGSPGAGTVPNLAMEMIAHQEKVKFEHIPFQGDTPMIAAILGGHVMTASSSALPWISHVKAGTLRLLLVFSENPMNQWPAVPTLKQLGYDHRVSVANIISAPKGTPKPIIDQLAAAFSEGMKSPQYQKAAHDQELLSSTPLAGPELQNWIQTQYTLYGTLINQLGLKKKE